MTSRVQSGPKHDGDGQVRMTLRERKQQAARDHVADAAAPLFVRDGYLATTTRNVARAAGVAEGTIFNLFGSKAGLLLAALQRSVPDLDVGAGWAGQAGTLSDPVAVVEFFCRTGSEVADQALPLVRVFIEAANVDERVAATWRAQEEFRLGGQTWVLDVLESGGWLRTDRGRDDLVRDLWVIGAPEMHLKWRDSGMDEADFRRWRHGALCTLLIDPDAGN
jgi:AcrR family transcriptional regulator